jgi:uncharacterized protein (TIGR02246 family)
MALNGNGALRGRLDPAPHPVGRRPPPAAARAGWTTGDDPRDDTFDVAEPGHGGPRAPDHSTANGSEARTTIDGLVDLLVSAWNRHDAAAFAAGFAEDVAFTNVFGVTVYGRAAIETAHAAIFRAALKDSTLTAADTCVRFVRADVAAVDLRWEMTAARGPAGHAGPKRHGLMTMVATEQAGAWRFTVCHNQDLPPPERLATAAGLLKGYGIGG